MAVSGYQTSNGNEHVIFIGADNHVYELVYKHPKWGYNDLTKTKGAKLAAVGSPVVGYQTSNGYEHVNYIGVDQHVHELIYTDQWADNDLTVNASKYGPTPNPVPGSAIDAYQTSNGYEHVNYIGAVVYELIYTDQWKDNDLHLHVVGPGGAAAGSATPLKGLVTSNGKEHVFYTDVSGRVHELIYTALPGTSEGWFDNTLGGNAAPTTQLTAYQTSNGYEHVNYVDFKGHVRELIYTGEWKDNDLTTHTKPKNAPVADSEKGLAGYQTSNGYEHVNYMDDQFHVYELIYTGEWAWNDLTVSAGVPAEAEMSLAGD